MVNPNEQVLTVLRDIHLPSRIGWWPLAPLWYLLLVGVLLSSVVGIIWIKHHFKKMRPKRQALHLLDLFQKQYNQHGDSQRYSARISELLRRVAVAYYPRASVASLKEEDWLLFLNATANGVDFQAVKYELLALPYQKSGVADLNLLFNLTRQWISQRRGRCLS